MPAVAVLAVFMGIQVFNGMLSLVNPAYGGSVGWWAHIGGFLAGAALAALAPRRRLSRPAPVTSPGRHDDAACAGRPQAMAWPARRPAGQPARQAADMVRPLDGGRRDYSWSAPASWAWPACRWGT